MPECKAARERNDVRRQDVLAYPVELSREGHDRSLAAQADIVSAVRTKFAPARIQSDDASARVHHMSVAVERQDPIGAAVDEEQSIGPTAPKPARIDDARIGAEHAEWFSVVGEGENFSITRAVRASRTCDEEVISVSIPIQGKLSTAAIRLYRIHPLGKSELVAHRIIGLPIDALPARSFVAAIGGGTATSVRAGHPDYFAAGGRSLWSIRDCNALRNESSVSIVFVNPAWRSLTVLTKARGPSGAP